MHSRLHFAGDPFSIPAEEEKKGNRWDEMSQTQMKSKTGFLMPFREENEFMVKAFFIAKFEGILKKKVSFLLCHLLKQFLHNLSQAATFSVTWVATYKRMNRNVYE